MNLANILAILSMITTAEPAIIQLVHDLLASAGGETDQAILTADSTDWAKIIATAEQSLPPSTAS